MLEEDVSLLVSAEVCGACREAEGQRKMHLSVRSERDHGRKKQETVWGSLLCSDRKLTFSHTRSHTKTQSLSQTNTHGYIHYGDFP